jgi:hypothetical protein
LADSVTVTADVSDTVQAVNINRGRNALSDVFQTGTCSVVIADQDGAFNPNNTASPYYGLIQPLRKITITATDPSTGLVWAMFAGYTTGFNYQQSRDVGIVSTTTITAVDGFRLANLATLTTVTGSAAGDLASTRISQILDAIAWPASMRDIDTAATTVQANPTTSATALAKLQQATDSEYGAIYIDASGNTGTTHGLWNPYDTHIPLLWYGWGIRKGKTLRETSMSDIAPTLAALLRVQMPSGNIGTAISEVIK